MTDFRGQARLNPPSTLEALHREVNDHLARLQNGGVNQLGARMQIGTVVPTDAPLANQPTLRIVDVGTGPAWYTFFGGVWVPMSTLSIPSPHVLATTVGLGSQHTVSGLTARQVLIATGATTALFRALVAADLPALSDLSGQIAYAQLPSGGGTWANGGTLSITGGAVSLGSLLNIKTVTGLAAAAGDILIGGHDGANANLILGVSGAFIQFLANRAETSLVAPSAVGNDAIVLSIKGRPHDGSAYVTTASIELKTTGVQASGGNHGSHILFRTTTTTAAASIATVGRFDADGSFTVGVNSGTGTGALFAGLGTLTSLAVGAITSTGLLQTTLTTQQLSLRYDASNHLAVTVSSAGAVTYDATGASASHIFPDRTFFTITTDPTLAAVSGAVIVGGDGTGQHIALGKTGIESKATATTSSSLLLQTYGGGVVLGDSLGTENANVFLVINTGTNAGANNKDNSIAWRRGGISQWLAGILGATIAANANWTLWDDVNNVTALAAVQGALPNLAMFSQGSFGGGLGVLSVANANTNPSSNPSGGGILYSTGGAGTWRGSSGTVTTFGPADPHCPDCGRDFAWQWENTKYGKLVICAWCASESFRKGVIERRAA
jgi:hypothetical protein